MAQIRLKAYAKVNLTLDVIGRRNDGYHLLKSVMQSVSLADQITLTPQTAGIAVKANPPIVPTGQDNIVWKAATAFQNLVRLKKGLLIEIEKRIPVSAGLAGGSANAAAVLMGLNSLYKTGLSLPEMQSIGLRIGADLPFCLQGGTALAEGIGERLTPLAPFYKTIFVIIKPKEKISAATVYQKLAPSAYGTSFSRNLLRLLEGEKPVSEIRGVLGNALESVTGSIVPEINIWKQRLLAAGAHSALMSGSGPAVFGVFTGANQAKEFQRRWEAETKIFLAKPVKVGILEMNGGDPL